jgi:hypothetical protein
MTARAINILRSRKGLCKAIARLREIEQLALFKEAA